jgi:uncharacterized membrane protein YjfL (UPF0719 family)
MSWQTILFVASAMTIMVIVARLINQVIMKVKITDALIKRDNPALGIAMAGYLFGVVMIANAVLIGDSSGDLLRDALLVGAYGIGGIVFLALVAMFGLKILHALDYVAEIEKGNVAVGIAAAGRFVATSFIIAGVVSGESQGGTWVTAIVFFLAGQLALIALAWLYRQLTSYNDSQEILSGNIAAAISYAGVMIGIGITIENGLVGTFVDYATGFAAFGKSLLVIVAFYPIRQFLVQGVLLGGGFAPYGGRLDSEISADKNVGAGVIEATAYIAVAILVTQLS